MMLPAPTPSPRSPPSRSTSSWSAAGSPARAWRSTPPRARLLGRARRERDYASGTARARPSSSTAACATCRTSTSAWSARRCSSASSCRQLAPHLVHPLPLVVPAFDGARPDRLVGHRPEHVRRHGGRPDPARAAAAGARRDLGRGLEPRPPPHHRRRRGRASCSRARRPRTDRRLPVLRLPDRRRAARADRPRRGRALRRGVGQPASR